MRENSSVLLLVFGLFSVFSLMSRPAKATEPLRDWTMLVYLNGDNNLDSFGTTNLLQMETVGSTDNLNVVVQWASIQNKKTQRLLVKKSTDPTKVTSPVVQDMGVVDMGNWQNLEGFIEWGAANYPARHYFVDVWDHGSGWHAVEFLDHGKLAQRRFHPNDISWDDNSGNSITTKQLGQAITQASQAIGQKIDIYGSDACLMGMVEVASEMKDSVSYFLGSQEVEPGAGWPYDSILQRWTAQPQMGAADISTVVSEEYAKYYSTGAGGGSSATMAAYDLGHQAEIESAIGQLAKSITSLSAKDLTQVSAAAQATQAFEDQDYGDLLDFVNRLGSDGLPLSEGALGGVKAAYENYVIANHVTPGFMPPKGGANGVSIWLPKSNGWYAYGSALYETMDFEIDTGWGGALKAFNQGSDAPRAPSLRFIQ